MTSKATVNGTKKKRKKNKKSAQFRRKLSLKPSKLQLTKFIKRSLTRPLKHFVINGSANSVDTGTFETILKLIRY